jgi:hypothetical protein
MRSVERPVRRSRTVVDLAQAADTSVELRIQRWLVRLGRLLAQRDTPRTVAPMAGPRHGRELAWGDDRRHAP